MIIFAKILLERRNIRTYEIYKAVYDYCVIHIFGRNTEFAAAASSIYGMVLLFAALMTGVIKLPRIEETADLLLNVMPIFFISPTVSIMSSVGLMKDNLFGVFFICIVSTMVVMAVTGWVAQAVMKHSEKEAKD